MEVAAAWEEGGEVEGAELGGFHMVGRTLLNIILLLAVSVAAFWKAWLNEHKV